MSTDKTCSRCDITKPVHEYYARSNHCKDCRRESQKAATRREKEGDAYEDVLQQKRKYARERHSNPEEKLLSIQRTRIRLELGRLGLKKSRPMLELIGCSKAMLVKWIESNFTEGMTWQNIGKVFQVDHVIAIAAFDLSSSQGQEACFHWSNLYPMLTEVNQRKGKHIWDDFALEVQRKAEAFVSSLKATPEEQRQV